MAEFSSDQALFFMKEALSQSLRAWKKGEVPVGAVLVSGTGKILSSAHNSSISLDDPTAHAEILALRHAGRAAGNYRLTDTWMFVTLEPCIMCAGALVWARVKGVVFGARDPRSGAFGSVLDINRVSGLNHRIQVSRGLLEDECSRILRDFFQRRRQAKNVRNASRGTLPKHCINT